MTQNMKFTGCNNDYTYLLVAFKYFFFFKSSMS